MLNTFFDWLPIVTVFFNISTYVILFISLRRIGAILRENRELREAANREHGGGDDC